MILVTNARQKRQEPSTLAPPPDTHSNHEDPNRPPDVGHTQSVAILEPYVFLNFMDEFVVLDGLVLRFDF